MSDQEEQQKPRRWLRNTLKRLAYAVAGALLVLGVIGIRFLNSKPGLEPWHHVVLDKEFTNDSEVADFAGYLALEEQLFAQLRETVYQPGAGVPGPSINRFQTGSLSDPARWPKNWNRTYEFPAQDGARPQKGGALLLHGLSDSPYSLRHLGERLNEAGLHVIGLRIPGHGTAPSGLTRVTWEDMAAAVRLAMQHLAQQVGEAPIYMIGYSNGAALSLNYALTARDRSALPQPDRLVLISPEIAISPMARFAIWQERFGRWLRLEKLGWTSVQPEYDPFKYASFTVNAGDLAYRLTKENREAIARLSDAGKLDSFPPVLALQSALDTTVAAPALLNDLFLKLPESGHELVVFDLNRTATIEHMLIEDPVSEHQRIVENPDRHFALTLVTNEHALSPRVILRSWAPRESRFRDIETDLSWPEQVYSLSHVALPFPPHDPLYGNGEGEESPGIQLGAVAPRGEKRMSKIPASEILRLRWNPFYSYLEERVLAHLGLVD